MTAPLRAPGVGIRRAAALALAALPFAFLSPPSFWRTFGLQPHRTETFKPSPDPQPIDKVRDIVGL